MTQLIPAVAVHDLRLMWKIRQEFPRQSVDLHIVRPLATEGADLLAASLRVDFLRLLILQDSDAFGDLVNKGQPTDRLLEVFAKTPLESGGRFSIRDFVEKQIKPSA